MKIVIRAKNLELTESIEKYLDEKLSSLEKFIGLLGNDEFDKGQTLAEIIVEVEKESNHHRKGDIFRSELQVYLPGKNIVVEARSDDLYKAIVESKKELKLEIEQYKLKGIERQRREQRKIKEDNKI